MALELTREKVTKMDKVKNTANKLPTYNTLEEFVPPYYEEGGYIDDYSDSGYICNFSLDKIITKANMLHASDIHLDANNGISYSILGDIRKDDVESIDDEILTDLTRHLLTNEEMGNYVKDLEIDTSYTVRRGGYKGQRLRVNICKSYGIDTITLRLISENIPSCDMLGLAQREVNIFENKAGIILVCGSTGQGKSTTLASIVNKRLKEEAIKVVTLENPIEYQYKEIRNYKGIVIQREKGGDFIAYEAGLKSCLRQAPNVIVLQEVRDKNEVKDLLIISETGHLALSTLHTSTCVESLSRIISLYDVSERSYVIDSLSTNLKAIMNQILVKDVSMKKRIAVRETLYVDNKIKELIKQWDLQAIEKELIARGENIEFKMARMVQSGIIFEEEAYKNSSNKVLLKYFLEKL